MICIREYMIKRIILFGAGDIKICAKNGIFKVNMVTCMNYNGCSF